jgi:TRAP-type C4-dicarboxylate transport system permease small subunit
VVANVKPPLMVALATLCIINLSFVGLASRSLRLGFRDDPVVTHRLSPRVVVAEVTAGFAGLAIIGFAFLPLLVTADSVAFRASGEFTPPGSGPSALLVYGALPVGAFGALVGWLCIVALDLRKRRKLATADQVGPNRPTDDI